MNVSMFWRFSFVQNTTLYAYRLPTIRLDIGETWQKCGKILSGHVFDNFQQAWISIVRLSLQRESI